MASLESGEIAGIAVTLSAIAIVLLVLLLVFFVRQRNSCSTLILRRKPTPNVMEKANGHIHQTLKVPKQLCFEWSIDTTNELFRNSLDLFFLSLELNPVKRQYYEYRNYWKTVAKCQFLSQKAPAFLKYFGVDDSIAFETEKNRKQPLLISLYLTFSVLLPKLFC